MEAVLTEHREHEKNLQATMTTAQKLSDDIKASAGARGQAHHPRSRRALRSAAREGPQARGLEDIQREIDGLRLKRKDVEDVDRSDISTLRNTLEFVREQEARERDDKILMHRPRIVEPIDSEAHQARKNVG